MQILITPDKFKGSLSALGVAQAIARGIHRVDASVDCTIQPLADGGDGSLDVLAPLLGAEKHQLRVSDPLGRSVEAAYYLKEDTAFVEMAAASGLVLLNEQERNPLQTTTLGTGELMWDAIQRGARTVYLFLGGSATNDAGMGIAQALGYRFLNEAGTPIPPTGGSLAKVRSIQKTKDWPELNVYCLCDVQNPLLGPQGATHTYAPQKGADTSKVEVLEAGMKQFAEVLHTTFGADVSKIPGGGAAGGIAAGLHAMLGAEIRSGIATILELTGAEDKLRQADLVISGEGRLDEQTLEGKVIQGVLDLCRTYRKPLVLFVGQNQLDAEDLKLAGIQSVKAVLDKAESVEEAMTNTALFLEELAEEWWRSA